MADAPYERVKGGRLTFKGGAIATIDKKKKSKKKNKINKLLQSTAGGGGGGDVVDNEAAGSSIPGGGGVVYTIDAAKKMKYEELFPVETKKFGYDPNAVVKSVEDALDERIKKKADRYCK